MPGFPIPLMYYPPDEDTQGTLWAWGEGTSGMLGDGTAVAKSSPVQIGAATNYAAASISSVILASTGIIDTDGRLFTWGNAASGVLGDGTTTNKSSPVQIGGLDWAIMGMGAGGFGTDQNTIAVKRNGQLWIWGNNSSGQLADGTVVNKSSPIQVGALATWAQAVVGNQFWLARKSDNTLWACGANVYGQLGDGTTVAKTSPIQIGSAEWEYINCGPTRSFGIKTNGTLWAWGDNTNGALGDGTSTSRSSPVQIGAATNWSRVFSGGQDTSGTASDRGLTAFLNSSGQLWVCGYNGTGALGDGTLVNKSSPIQWGGGGRVIRGAAAGTGHMMVVTTGGDLFGSGSNNNGQIGDGSSGGNYSSPVQIGGSWVDVFAGGAHTWGIKAV